jgi:hypothetical protein
MSTPRGIFEAYQIPSALVDAPQPSSPFGVAPEGLTQSPFTAANPIEPRKESPFSVVNVGDEQEDPKTIRLPERRKQAESPFQIAEPQGFGFEAPAQVARVNPFVPVSQSQQPAPFSPFTVEHHPSVPAPYPAHPGSFGGWAQTDSATAPPAYPSQPHPQYQALAPQTLRSPLEPTGSDSYHIKQLELRAIFGVDREMSKEEIIQRARSLPGVRQIAMVSAADIAAVDALKQVISNLGFGNGALRLYSGSVPIEFIREGHTLLAIQTDGGFAPGVRETLMLVARELSR